MQLSLHGEVGWRYNERVNMARARAAAQQQSMERFGPVSVDYFTGQRVESVEPEDDGWVITFDSGAKIKNHDPTIGIPKAIVGAALTRTILETKRTRLQFGLEQVILNPIEYSIIDSIYTNNVEVFAQRSEANMPQTPPHPDERIADGPDERTGDDLPPDEEVEEE